MGYALFARKGEENQTGPPSPETASARPNAPAA
jgi:hypothetical protein